MTAVARREAHIVGYHWDSVTRRVHLLERMPNGNFQLHVTHRTGQQTIDGKLYNTYETVGVIFHRCDRRVQDGAGWQDFFPRRRVP